MTTADAANTIGALIGADAVEAATRIAAGNVRGMVDGDEA